MQWPDQHINADVLNGNKCDISIAYRIQNCQVESFASLDTPAFQRVW
jgi:hypothetical protein